MHIGDDTVLRHNLLQLNQSFLIIINNNDTLGTKMLSCISTHPGGSTQQGIKVTTV